MESSPPIESHREGAEVHSGDAVLCRAKCAELLEELRLPRGLLPLDRIEEVGYNRATGFVWLRQRGPTQHSFRRAGRLVSYAAVVTAFAEERRMTRMTGVKSKELVLWVPVSDVHIADPASGKISFRSSAGLSRCLPVSAFDGVD